VLTILERYSATVTVIPDRNPLLAAAVTLLSQDAA